MARSEFRESVVAHKVPQWLEEWNKVEFDPKFHRRQPQKHFYLFSLPATILRALTGIQRRDPHSRLSGQPDLGIQRRHDSSRSDEIGRFIKYGYPWSEMSEAKRKSGEFDDLRKPGWLPTAVIVNILTPGEERPGRERLSKTDAIRVTELDDASATIALPSGCARPAWQPAGLHPLEIIDGQHRLWAFQGGSGGSDFHLPVVAYLGLDISWQAYLFWTINIKPKRINASLAFDLYPLLRTEDWLTRFEGHSIYRETRAQELTEALWSYPKSPWHRRINMLGESREFVSQAAWIRSLMASFIKSWEGRGTRIGGLFGSPVGTNELNLPWSRAQQAAFLIVGWEEIVEAIESIKPGWAKQLAENRKALVEEAVFGAHALLSTDQGVRVVLQLLNDFTYLVSDELHLAEWEEADGAASDDERVAGAIKSLRNEPVTKHLERLARAIITYDWRTSSAPGLAGLALTQKLAFRGSSGYRELRKQVLLHIESEHPQLKGAARAIRNALDL